MRFRQAQLPAGLEPFEFGELGRIAVVTGSGSNGEAVAAAKTGYLAQQVGVAKRRELRLTQAWSCKPLATSDSVRIGCRSVTMMETWCKGQDRFAFGRRVKGGQNGRARLSSCKVNWQWRGIPGGFGAGQGYMEKASRLTAKSIQLRLLVKWTRHESLKRGSIMRGADETM